MYEYFHVVRDIYESFSGGAGAGAAGQKSAIFQVSSICAHQKQHHMQMHAVLLCAVHGDFCKALPGSRIGEIYNSSNHDNLIVLND